MSKNEIVITKNNTNFKVIYNPYTSWVWNEILNNRWEEETFKIFDRFIDPEYSYMDIGAWIGPTVLFGANKAKHTYAIEPDPVALNELKMNLDLNPHIASNVTCINAAIAKETGEMKLYKRHRFGDSTSSLIPTISDQYYQIKTVSIEDLIKENDIRDVNFIKMDIEGGEYTIIPSLYSYLIKNKPTLYLSMHPGFLLEHYNLMKNNHIEIDSPIIQIEKLLNSLSFYKNIYDISGNLVDKKTILDVKYTGEFIFTNEEW